MIDHTTYPARVRKMLAGTTPGEWESSPYTTGRVMRRRKDHECLTVGAQIVATAESDADAALIAETPTLAAAYLDAVAKIDRLFRLLAVEQGYEAPFAPDGWTHDVDLTDDGAVREYVWTGPTAYVCGSPNDGWRVTDMRTGRIGAEVYEHALEAMEAADAAQEPIP